MLSRSQRSSHRPNRLAYFPMECFMSLSRNPLMMPLSLMLALLAGGLPSSAMALPPIPCTPAYKGTNGNDSISVDMATLGSDTTTVVCPKGGNDNIQIQNTSSIASGVRLIIAKGNGNLSIQWNSPTTTNYNSSYPYASFYLIRPPLANRGTYTVGGSTGTAGVTVRMLCATNIYYTWAPSETDFWSSGGYISSGPHIGGTEFGYVDFTQAGSTNQACYSNP